MHIKLLETDERLPYLDKEFLHIRPLSIHEVNNSVIRRLSIEEQNRILFPLLVDEPAGAYPRFNTDDCLYSIARNPIYNILPDLQNIPKNINFDSITDNRAIELIHYAKNYDKIYLFWSGGIDSTVILCSLIKNLDRDTLAKVVVVLNGLSVIENPNMYYTHIHKKLKTENTDNFFNGTIRLANDAIYLTGDTADAIMGYSNLSKFDLQYPQSFLKPWKTQVDILVKYFNSIFAYEYIVDSLHKNKIEVDTVYDFLWWITFNWGYDVELYFSTWVYSLFPEEEDLQQFLEKNCFTFFNTLEYQQWSVSAIGTSWKIRDAASTNKFAFKKYIFDFNKDIAYFDTKLKEASIPKNAQFKQGNRFIGIDTDYYIYFREFGKKFG